MGLGIETLLKSGKGFETAKPLSTKRLIMAITGKEKQGKTHFALTAPGPIVVFDIDDGCEGVVRAFPDKQIILWNDAHLPVLSLCKDEQDLQDKADIEWKKFLGAYEMVLRNKDIRTVVLDTATEFNELLRLAKLGKLSEVPPNMYSRVNPEFRALFKMAKNTDKNILFLHHMSPVYVGRNRTDKWERQGYSKTGAEVEVEVILDHLPKTFERLEPIHRMTITNCRFNPKLEGTTMDEPLCTFPFLAATVKDDTQYEDWL